MAAQRGTGDVDTGKWPVLPETPFGFGVRFDFRGGADFQTAMTLS
ncbi:hypothetical protein [uncultured Sphingomonas sp.]|nr:hypothetical protein [uncultured Sphingomonas sp.]